MTRGGISHETDRRRGTADSHCNDHQRRASLTRRHSGLRRLGCHGGFLGGEAGPPGDCLRRQQKLRHGNPDRHRHRQDGKVDHGRWQPQPPRDHAERKDRLRRRGQQRHGDPDRHRHRQDGKVDHGRAPPLRRRGHRDHSGREDGLCSRNWPLGHGDPDQDRHQQGRQGDHGRQLYTPAPSRSPRTARPPTSAVDSADSRRHGDPDQHRHQQGRHGDQGRRAGHEPSRSRRTARPPTSPTTRNQSDAR